uniref:Glycosyltransferase 61 catalytic domain-containing protein n=1 Tax=Chromera velia CCMP2878 TaxID=1169474 RepID=A0A0G4FB76_9ALVE|eukprot:Cvel_16134.t1-p1 / transcript=Cvel_16134.t1 / gene=Cvel_16134 / organism=Chromera_velia_CCMP2878 / gene_product=hypothetical protein / transcript_product=hypothetical protein / location=Cvel_scaffold1228:6261-10367(-) / protein_length=733 / sequence_SO=supercontig / SO=protein_coding / is_pseudo=false
MLEGARSPFQSPSSVSSRFSPGGRRKQGVSIVYLVLALLAVSGFLVSFLLWRALWLRGEAQRNKPTGDPLEAPAPPGRTRRADLTASGGGRGKVSLGEEGGSGSSGVYGGKGVTADSVGSFPSAPGGVSSKNQKESSGPSKHQNNLRLRESVQSLEEVISKLSVQAERLEEKLERVEASVAVSAENNQRAEEKKGEDEHEGRTPSPSSSSTGSPPVTQQPQDSASASASESKGTLPAVSDTVKPQTTLDTSPSVSSSVEKILRGDELHEFFSLAEKRDFDETIARLEELREKDTNKGLSQKCKNYAGSGLVSALRKNKADLCVPGSGPSSWQVHWTTGEQASMKDFVFLSATNVSIEQKKVGGDTPVKLQMRADCDLQKPPSASIRTDLYSKANDKNNLLDMGATAVRESPLKCDSVIDHSILILDGSVDLWNWWWLWVKLHRQVLAVVADAEETTGPPQVVFTSALTNDGTPRWKTIERGREPLGDFFEYAISASAHQAIHLKTSPLPEGHRVCAKHVIWVPPSPNILQNHEHPDSGKCFSSFMAAAQIHVRSNIGLPTRPRGKVPRVVYIARDSREEMNWTSWQKQRLVKNENEVIARLREECEKRGIPFEDLHFYGDGLKKSFREQALLASRGDILVGLHGAGLNLFLFLPPQSVVCELSLGMTNIQKNSQNTAAMVDGGYVRVGITKGGDGKLDGTSIGNAWEKGVKASIKKWFELGGDSKGAEAVLTS